MTVPGTWPASGLAVWNGVFNLKTFFQAPGFTNDPIWYFIGQSIQGKSVSADQSGILYPNGDWQDNQTFTTLEYDHTTGTWFLFLQSTNVADLNVGTWTFINHDPSNPAGVYTLSSAPGFTTPPNIITVAAVGGVCCPNWSQMQWTAPILAPGNGGGTCSGSGVGNTVTITGTGGGASCSQVTGLTGTLNYAGRGQVEASRQRAAKETESVRCSSARPIQLERVGDAQLSRRDAGQIGYAEYFKAVLLLHKVAARIGNQNGEVEVPGLRWCSGKSRRCGRDLRQRQTGRN
jgi:hypothetical protein